MESTRRPFERSRELGLKKPRLAQPEEPINLKNSISNKFRATNDRERDSGSVDSGRGSYSQQQQIEELVVQYREALTELTFNSKPIITNLTIIAGENLHAAKAIATTICANILEVPSEQKLPSLYLLDSIVKNIGRDYIKYFGAKLPEVFCKAYRQVDPSTHPGMRHLFGTWKGVFPPQPLQMIEKELAFVPAANGSSSGSAISRSESQSQRPATSIHVNPKYLEARQRLQQPSRTKEVASVTMVNSLQEAGRLDQAVGMSSGRQWPESTLKAQGTRRQRNAPDELIRQKNIVAAYGSYDHDSDHSSQSGLEIGVKERVIDKPWYGANNNLEEKISIHRNGLDIKQVSSYVTPLAGKTNVPLLPKKGISGKSSIAIDESWKSSDEEEYMWDDLNSKSSDQHSLGVPQRHRWTPDEPNRTGFENDLWRPQSLNELGSKVNKEASADARDQAHFRNRRSPSWTEEQHLTDETVYSVSDRGRLCRQEGFTNPLSGVSTPANSLTGVPILPHMSPSHIGSTSFGFLTKQELVPPVSVGQKRSFVSDSLAEQDYRPSQLPRRSEITKSQFLGTQNMVSQFSRDTLPSHPQDTLVVHSPKFPPKNLQSSTSVVHTAPPRHHIPVVEPSKKISQPSLAKTRASENIPSGKSLLNQSIKNSAVDSIKKNEIRKNKTGTVAKKSPSARHPPLPSGLAAKVTPSDPRLCFSKSETSPVKVSASTSPSQTKAEKQPLPPGIPPSSQASGSASDPVSSLLSTLMAKGLITASKSESPTSSTQQISTSSPNSKPSTVNSSPVPVSSVPVASNKKDSTETIKPPISAEKCSTEEAKPLIGLEFKPDLIRHSHPSVIEGLLHNLPHQCDLCGLRLKLQERLERHLEWHASRKPEDSRQKSRRWYTNQENWLAGEDITCSEEGTSDEQEKEGVMVPADESQCVCVLCGEIFEDVYCHKTDEWMFKGAIYLSVPLGDSEIGTSTGNASKGPIVHADCIAENSLKDLGFPEA